MSSPVNNIESSSDFVGTGRGVGGLEVPTTSSKGEEEPCDASLGVFSPEGRCILRQSPSSSIATGNDGSSAWPSSTFTRYSPPAVNQIIK